MAAAAANYVGKKVMRKQFEKYNKNSPGGQYDPLFAEVPTSRTDRKGNPKMKRVKKQIPDYIPAHDAEILAKVRKRAYQLDMSLFNIAGQRFGWSSIIGFVPVGGDVLDALLALSVYNTANKIEGGLPSGTKAKMLAWIVFDGVVGMVPIAGDIADGLVRANCRMCRLLEECLDERYNPERKNGLETNHPPATVYEDASDEEHERKEYEYRPAHPQMQETGFTSGTGSTRRR